MYKSILGAVVIGVAAFWAGCGSSTTTTNASSSSSGDADAGTDDDAGATCTDDVDTTTGKVCTSNKTWSGGDRGSVYMHPGRACIDCHAQTGGPDNFTFAGTVFPTVHEPDDCNGVDGTQTGLKVVVTGADGTVVKATVNAAGNFYQTTKFTKPFTAKLVDQNGNERAMCIQQTKTDCNSCHTQTGANDAPGRIVAPAAAQ